MLTHTSLFKLIALFITCFVTCGLYAQTPEAKQAEAHAKEYMQRGDMKNAIITYRQAINLWPEKTSLYVGLGKALYLNGDNKNAVETLQKVTDKPDATAEAYQLLAASEEELDEKKAAKRIIGEGLIRFPGEGGLYQELGKEYAAEQKDKNALDAWQDGIEKCPGYADNYYSAAEIYLSSAKPLWGLLYGEQYLYLPHDTVNDDHIKQLLLKGYSKFFEQLATAAPANAGHSFEEAVNYIYSTLTPVISDGVTTEHLGMIRTRFLMEWFATYNKEYPFPLFSFQQLMTSTGHFEMANEWQFGKAESGADYELWNRFHEGDISRFKVWLEINKPELKTTNYNKGSK